MICIACHSGLDQLGFHRVPATAGRAEAGYGGVDNGLVGYRIVGAQRFRHAMSVATAMERGAFGLVLSVLFFRPELL